MSKLNGKQNHPAGRRVVAGLCMFALSAAPACRGGSGGSGTPPTKPQDDGLLASDPAESRSFPTSFDPNDQIDPSERVGSLPGGLMVGPDGSARYRIDFLLAEEFGGNTANLGLVYNGRASGGDAGRGWSLSGLSSISRCPITSAAGPYLERPDGQALPTEGLRSPAGIDALDKDDLYSPENGADAGLAAARERYANLCLNGALLYQVPLDGANPPPKAERAFRVQGRPFARVFLYGNGSFEEHAESGIVRHYTGSRYARTRNGTMSRAFVLDLEQDKYGHEVSYEYSWDGDDHDNHRLTEVSYTGGRVELEWGESEERFGYFHGMRATSTALLERVRVYGGNDGLARTYELRHEQSALSGRDLLTSATVCDRDGVCLPATRFEYTAPELTTDSLSGHSGFGVESALTIADADRETAAFSDVDGDGIADLVYLTESPVLLIDSELVLSIRHGDGGGSFLPAREYSVELPGLEQGSDDRTQLQFADVTGDGLADPLIISGFRDHIISGMDWGGAYVEAVDASDREGEISTKYTWRVGGDLPWGCDSTYMELCGGGGGPSKWDYDPDDWASSAYYGEQGFSGAISDFDELDYYEGEGEEKCQFPPDPSDKCRAAVPLGVSFMDLTGNGAEEPLPCVGFADVFEGERSDIYWGNADELYSFVSNSDWNIPNGVFGPEDPESRTTCGSWGWGLSAFAQIDVTGEGTRDLLTYRTLPPNLLTSWNSVADETYSARSVEFGMSGVAQTDLYLDLLQRYARLDTRGEEDVLEGADTGESSYNDLFTSDTRGGPSGDLQADLNGDGLVDLVRLEPTAGFVNGNPGEIDAFIDSDPRLACKEGTAESELPARAAVYFNRGDGSFEQGPTRTGFVWQDYCRCSGARSAREFGAGYERDFA